MRHGSLRFAGRHVPAVSTSCSCFLHVRDTFACYDLREHLAPLRRHEPSQYSAGVS
jgi:hypothetical protein